MSQKTLFEIALVLVMNMTVKVTTTMMPVTTTMKTKDEQALAKLHITQIGFRGEALN
jgi:hypothetical protein